MMPHVTGPMPAANQLNHQLNLFHQIHGGNRFPVDVEALTLDVSKRVDPDHPVTIQGADLPGLEGALYRVENKSQPNRHQWAILYNNRVSVPGRLRFTLAHELGHYLLHRQMQDTFNCSQGDMLDWQSDERKMESEADIFASYLLMPMDDFRRQVTATTVDMDALGHCADRYGVSLTAATLKWLEFTEQRAVLVVSRDGYINWARSSESALKSGAFFRTRNAVLPIPDDSLAARQDGQNCEKNGINLDARVWFPREPQGMPVREMKIVSDQYDQTLSLLIMPKAEPRWGRSADDDDGVEDTLSRFERNGQPLVR